jgi:hypothetical protein
MTLYLFFRQQPPQRRDQSPDQSVFDYKFWLELVTKNLTWIELNEWMDSHSSNSSKFFFSKISLLYKRMKLQRFSVIFLCYVTKPWVTGWSLSSAMPIFVVKWSQELCFRLWYDHISRATAPPVSILPPARGGGNGGMSGSNQLHAGWMRARWHQVCFEPPIATWTRRPC